MDNEIFSQMEQAENDYNIYQTQSSSTNKGHKIKSRRKKQQKINVPDPLSSSDVLESMGMPYVNSAAKVEMLNKKNSLPPKQMSLFSDEVLDYANEPRNILKLTPENYDDWKKERKDMVKESEKNRFANGTGIGKMETLANQKIEESNIAEKEQAFFEKNKVKYNNAFRDTYQNLLSGNGVSNIKTKRKFLDEVISVPNALEKRMAKAGMGNFSQTDYNNFSEYLEDVATKSSQFKNMRQNFRKDSSKIRGLLRGEGPITLDSAREYLSEGQINRIEKALAPNESKSMFGRLTDKFRSQPNENDLVRKALENRQGYYRRMEKEANRAYEAALNGDLSGYENVGNLVSREDLQKNISRRKAEMREKGVNKSSGKKFGKGIFGVAMGVLGLAGVTSMMFAGGHRSNAELYNSNPQPQYYS